MNEAEEGWKFVALRDNGPDDALLSQPVARCAENGRALVGRGFEAGQRRIAGHHQLCGMPPSAA